MHKEIDKDIIVKSEELYNNYLAPIELDVHGAKEIIDFNELPKRAYQQGAMDERYADQWISRDVRLPTIKDTNKKLGYVVLVTDGKGVWAVCHYKHANMWHFWTRIPKLPVNKP